MSAGNLDCVYIMATHLSGTVYIGSLDGRNLRGRASTMILPSEGYGTERTTSISLYRATAIDGGSPKSPFQRGTQRKILSKEKANGSAARMKK